MSRIRSRHARGLDFATEFLRFLNNYLEAEAEKRRSPPIGGVRGYGAAVGVAPFAPSVAVKPESVYCLACKGVRLRGHLCPGAK